MDGYVVAERPQCLAGSSVARRKPIRKRPSDNLAECANAYQLDFPFGVDYGIPQTLRNIVDAPAVKDVRQGLQSGNTSSGRSAIDLPCQSVHLFRNVIRLASLEANQAIGRTARVFTSCMDFAEHLDELIFSQAGQ
ncbi:hypothetical protein AT5A_24480 [Agrobacterium tumefaciens 5A]|nr:hypothetical protein AT5A_24480 [Agrobacterium tumefaciens 5A]